MKLGLYLSNVLEVLREDTDQALDLMSADISDLHSELEEGLAKQYNKDLRKRAQQDQTLAPHYRGVSPKLAGWGKEAHSYGMHAHGMEVAGKAPKEKIAAAHDEAGKAHQFAAVKLAAAGHEEPARMHKQAAQYHRNKVRDLGNMGEDAPPSPKLSYSGVVKTSFGESLETYILESYPEAVKQASMLAGKATKTAQAENGTRDQHDTAARLHLIAHGVAKAHGQEELAGKHMEFHLKHKVAARAVKTA